MEQEYLEVEFEAIESKKNNCICDACHYVCSVKKLRLPKTKFHDGKTLSTKYEEYWLCDVCEDALIDALNYTKKVVSNK